MVSGRFRLTQKARNNRVNGHSDFGGIYIPNLPSHTGGDFDLCGDTAAVDFQSFVWYNLIIDKLLKWNLAEEFKWSTE